MLESVCNWGVVCEIEGDREGAEEGSVSTRQDPLVPWLIRSRQSGLTSTVICRGDHSRREGTQAPPIRRTNFTSRLRLFSRPDVPHCSHECPDARIFSHDTTYLSSDLSSRQSFHSSRTRLTLFLRSSIGRTPSPSRLLPPAKRGKTLRWWSRIARVQPAHNENKAVQRQPPSLHRSRPTDERRRAEARLTVMGVFPARVMWWDSRGRAGILLSWTFSADVNEHETRRRKVSSRRSFPPFRFRFEDPSPD